ncbi:MAG: ATP-binding cassette domain-containing protein, partial [Chloroflexi bacterium]|nr:ATP-binding cassette domain-containing protein [Chloroflexota bacterium]
MTSSPSGNPVERIVNSSPARSGCVLEMRGVCKVFGEGPDAVSALESLSMRAFEGEFVTIIGPSGCGKSTIFNVVSGLEMADRGEVLLRGERLSGQTGVVGYMPQRDLLLPWRTILN